MSQFFDRLSLWTSAVPPAAMTMALLAAASGAVLVATDRARQDDAVEFWTFANRHYELYGPPIEAWNASGAEPEVDLKLIGMGALARRTMDGFLAGIPTAPLIEVEVRLIGGLFAGPLESVGFLDLTDRLRDEGLLDQINGPSFSPWTKDGRIFGIPHDVHPVMLGYRADLTEAAGIDMESIETWDDFAEIMQRVQVDEDGDGRPDRYALNFWFTHAPQIEMLLLQAGGGVFSTDGALTIESEVNARVIATLAGWTTGPNRIAADAPEFDAAGNQLMADGFVASAFAPDWMLDVWKSQISSLDGKMKLMPLPAWEPGGRRTSVRGGSMLGIAKDAENHDELWAFAKKLYLDPELGRDLYRAGGIITPVSSLWDDPIYDTPDPFFRGQATGRMYIDLAEDVPLRPSSPFNQLAMARVQDALVSLVAYARDNGVYDAASLESEALRLLGEAEERVRVVIERNAFVSEPEETR